VSASNAVLSGFYQSLDFTPLLTKQNWKWKTNKNSIWKIKKYPLFRAYRSAWL